MLTSNAEEKDICYLLFIFESAKRKDCIIHVAQKLQVLLLENLGSLMLSFGNC